MFRTVTRHGARAPRSASNRPSLLADFQMVGQSGNTIWDSGPNAFHSNRLEHPTPPTWAAGGLFFNNSPVSAPCAVPLAAINSVQMLVSITSVSTNAAILGGDVTTSFAWGVKNIWPQTTTRNVPASAVPDAWTSQPIPAGRPVVLSFDHDPIGGSLYSQAVAAAINGVAWRYLPSTRTGTTSFGSRAYGFISFTGTIHRIRMHSTRISDAERADGLALLTAYGTANGLTPGLQEASTKRTLVAIGDSITIGTGTNTVNWPAALAASGSIAGPIDPYNLAVSGSLTSYVASIGPPNLPVLYRPAAPGNVCCIFSGTNDMVGGPTYATAVANILVAVNAALAAGYKVLVMPMVDRVSVSPSTKNGYNAALATAFGSTANVTNVPASAYAALTADGASSNTTYFQADGIHPNNAGAADIAVGGAGSDTGVLPYVNAYL